MNKDKEAIPAANGVGIADPFAKSIIARGQWFWLLLNQDAVPNVRHVWDHPSVDFSPPTKEAEKNKQISFWAKELGVTYDDLMGSCNSVVKTGQPIMYPGEKTKEEIKGILEDFDRYDLFMCWAEETGHEFENYGSECCPEYVIPDKLYFVDDSHPSLPSIRERV
jgi:hypothetical protein